MSVNSLSVDNQNQIVSFIRFFRSKRELALEQIQGCFDDTINDSLTEDMYTLDEVKRGYNSISHVVKDTTRDEVGSIINMTVLLLGQLFEQADQEEVYLEIDTACIEDQRLLEEVEKMTLDKRENMNKRGMKLKDTMIQMKKDLMQSESDKVLAQGKLASTEKKYKKEKRNTEELKRKIEELENRLNASEENSKEQEEGESKVDETARMITSLTMNEIKQSYRDEGEGKDGNDIEDMSKSELIDKLRESKSFINQLKEELECRLADSKQFQQLKKMLREKNVLVEELRRKINEEDGLDIEDDDE